MHSGRLPIEARAQQVLDLTHPRRTRTSRSGCTHSLRPAPRLVLEVGPQSRSGRGGSTASGRPSDTCRRSPSIGWSTVCRRRSPASRSSRVREAVAASISGARAHPARVASDCNDPLERQRMQLWTSLIVPPEMMGAHIGPPRAHTTHREASLDFRAGTAMWGHLGIEWNVAGPEASDPSTRAAITAWVSLTKSSAAASHGRGGAQATCRWTGRVSKGLWHGTVRMRLATVSRPRLRRRAAHGLLRLEGLDPERSYRVFPVGPVQLGETGMRAMPGLVGRRGGGSPRHAYGPRVVSSRRASTGADAPRGGAHPRSRCRLGRGASCWRRDRWWCRSSLSSWSSSSLSSTSLNPRPTMTTAVPIVSAAPVVVELRREGRVLPVPRLVLRLDAHGGLSNPNIAGIGADPLA